MRIRPRSSSRSSVPAGLGPLREGEREWGRVTGARPPLHSATPLVAWGAMAGLLSAVVIAVVGAPGPLDDPSPGDQRPGILTGRADARVVPAGLLPGRALGQRPVLVVFDRATPDRERLRAFSVRAGQRFTTRVVLPGEAGARVAAAIGMARPRDGGPPIGFALIASRRVRYATIDATYLQHGDELETVAGALP